MGVVLRGRDHDLGREVAVKVLREDHCGRPELVRRFIEEAQICGQLQHPGVVPVYEMGCLGDDRPYFAMKLVEGRTLATLLSERTDPAAERPRLLAVFLQVAQTVAYAQARGVIHRDLKPSNVMVGGFGEVQVMDWGLAKILPRAGATALRPVGAAADREGAAPVATELSNADASLSTVGSIMGTPAYMAPEQARGEVEQLDERCDVFALGSILCEILTGGPPFAGPSSSEIQRRAARADLADALARLDACGADPELVTLTKECLAAGPEGRPPDAGAVADRVTAHLEGAQRRLRAAELARVEAQARAGEERKRRWLTLTLAATVLGAASLGGGGWAWVARDRADRAAATACAVNRALDEAAMLRGQARSAALGDRAKWVEAVEAVKRAELILAQGDGSEDLHSRVRDLHAAVTEEYGEAVARAEAAWEQDKDRRMVERLAEIHADFSVHGDPALRDAQFAAAFRDYGIDVEVLDPAEAGARIAARPIAVELAGGLDNWANNRRSRLIPPDPRGAQRLLAVAKVADPDPWRNQLRVAFDRIRQERTRTLAELRRLAESADPATLPVTSVSRLASALLQLGDSRTAVSLLRIAQRLHPEDFWLTSDLGRALEALGPDNLDEAIRFLTAAVSIRPRSAMARSQLGIALSESGRTDEADAMFREAIRLGADNAQTARVALAEVLLDAGQPQDAITVLHEVIRVAPGLPAAHLDLGRALMALGRYEEALGPLGRARELGSRWRRRGPDADALLRRCEWLIALEGRLSALLHGDDRPANAAEATGFAELCDRRGFYATAVRLWEEAFTSPTTREDEPRTSTRFAAVCAAARAGSGQGKDDPPPGDAERSRLRGRARDWLDADLRRWEERIDAGSALAHRLIRPRLTHWKISPELDCVRDPEALAKLPPEERTAWDALWSRVDAVLARAGESRP
jgi:serine/threonine-protein kinase